MTGAFHIVFVCTANRFRSPLAAAVLQRELGSGAVPFNISSCGTLDVGALPPLVSALREASRYRLSLATHRARAMTRGGLADAELVLGFERAHLLAAINDGLARPAVTFTLAELVELLAPIAAPTRGARPVRALLAAAGRGRAGIPDIVPEIADPVGKPERVAEATARRIIELTHELAEAFRA